MDQQQFIYFYDLEQKYSDFTNDLRLLEQITYELESRRIIIKFIISKSDLKQFYNDYWEEYLIYIKTYSLIKNSFKQKYLMECEKQFNCKDFKLDFNTRKIIPIKEPKLCLLK